MKKQCGKRGQGTGDQLSSKHASKSITLYLFFLFISYGGRRNSGVRTQLGGKYDKKYQIFGDPNAENKWRTRVSDSSVHFFFILTLFHVY